MPSRSPLNEPAGLDDGEDRSVLSRAERPPDRTWRYGEHHDHVADVYLPDAPDASAPLVVLVHGGFWRPEYDRSHLRPLAAALAGHGAVVVSLEYRRVPGEPDTTIGDLKQALDALSREPWASGRPVVVAGHSAGGHLALLLAAQPGIGRCVALAPVADLDAARELGLDGDAVAAFTGDLDRPDLDPTRGPHPHADVVIVHGAADSLVPVELSRSYARAHPARVIVLDETGHFELIDPQSGAFGEVLTAISPAGIE